MKKDKRDQFKFDGDKFDRKKRKAGKSKKKNQGDPKSYWKQDL